MSGAEGEIDYKGKRVKYQIVEKGKNYTTFILHFELPDSQHEGFVMKVGDKIIAKGELAKAVRDAKIDGVEMAVAPPSGTNALIMMRVNRDVEEVLKEVLPVVEEFLKERGVL